MSSFKIGLIGCGFATRDRHLPALQRVAEAEVIALADVDPDSLNHVADHWRVPRRYLSAGELIKDRAVEAVAVCVPAAAHVEVALAAVDAGKHVFVEKPLALSLDDAHLLVERARRSSVKVMVGFNLRWHRLVRQARTLVGRGAIGSIQCVHSVFSDSMCEQSGLREWRLRRDLGGGALFEKAVHHFDLLRFLLEDEFEEVYAHSRRGRGEDETVSVITRMRSGVLATLLVSDATSVNNEITLYGESGALHVDCYRSDGLRLSSLTDLPGAPLTRLRRMIAAAKQLGTSVAEIRNGGAFNATYEAEWRHFIGAIRGDKAPACTLNDGLRALEIVVAATQSASLGQPVKIAQGPSVVTPIGSRTVGGMLAI